MSRYAMLCSALFAPVAFAQAGDRWFMRADDATVVAPQIAFLNYARTFYADLAYAKSSYGDAAGTAEPLDLEQLTPSIGFGFNEQRDWLQLRAYLIDSSNAARSRGEERTSALELKWTHWRNRQGTSGPDNLRFSVLAGERIHAVDHHAGGVYNLSDLQTGGASVGGEWRFGERNSVLLLAGIERFAAETGGRSYTNGFVYLDFAHRWN